MPLPETLVTTCAPSLQEWLLSQARHRNTKKGHLKKIPGYRRLCSIIHVRLVLLRELKKKKDEEVEELNDEPAAEQ